MVGITKYDQASTVLQIFFLGERKIFLAYLSYPSHELEITCEK